MHPINLIRTRLAVANSSGPGLFTGPRLDIHWSPLSTTELIKRHDIIKLVLSGHYGDMGMYSLLQQMFGHQVAANICVADGITYAKDAHGFQNRPKIPDPFHVGLNDFHNHPKESSIITEMPENVPTFISPLRPKAGIKVVRNVVVETDSSDELSIDERVPREVAMETAILAGKNMKGVSFPSISPLSTSKRPLKPAHSPDSTPQTLKRLRKGALIAIPAKSTIHTQVSKRHTSDLEPSAFQDSKASSSLNDDYTPWTAEMTPIPNRTGNQNAVEKLRVRRALSKSGSQTVTHKRSASQFPTEDQTRSIPANLEPTTNLPNGSFHFQPQSSLKTAQNSTDAPFHDSISASQHLARPSTAVMSLVPARTRQATVRTGQCSNHVPSKLPVMGLNSSLRSPQSPFPPSWYLDQSPFSESITEQLWQRAYEMQIQGL